MTVFDIDPTFSREKWVSHRKALSVAGARTIETTHRRKDGVEIPVELTINYLKRGEEGFSFSFINDISNRVRAEQREAEIGSPAAPSPKKWKPSAPWRGDRA